MAPLHAAGARAVRRQRPAAGLAAALTLALAASAAGQPPGPRDAVPVYAQPFPGAPPTEFEMPVLPAPDGLPRVSAAGAPLADDELVLGLVVHGRAVAWPIRHLGLWEVLNDRVAGRSLLLTWCPLAGTAAAFDVTGSDAASGFDFGYGLVNDNLLMVDRHTHSVWSQLAAQAVSGRRRGQRLALLAGTQATWGWWRRHHPHTLVAVAPGAVAQPYHYRAGRRGIGHDISSLGVGVVLDGEPWWFSLPALIAAGGELRAPPPRGPARVRAERSGLTAWVEEPTRGRLPAVLVYRAWWRAFHPDGHFWP